MKKINITDIHLSDYNPRTATEDFLENLNKSIEEFGLVDPIIINLTTNKIISGHQRYKILKESGITELNLIELGDIGWAFLSEELTIENEDYEKALNISLNKINAEFDHKKVNQILLELEDNGVDLNITGFDKELNETLIDFNNLGSSLTRERNTHIFEKFIFSDIEIDLTESESHKLNNIYQEYLNHFGVNIGFINYLLGGSDE